MSTKLFSSHLGFRITLAGVVIAILGIFVPWYSNPNVSGTALTLVSAVGALLPWIAIGMLAVTLIATVAFWGATAEGPIQTSIIIRFLALFLGLLALAGIYRVLSRGPTPEETLEVTVLAGAWIFGGGMVLGVIGTILDYAAMRAQRWTTVDLVLIVMCAAIYAAALLTLSFIKLTPGTWLRPGNALQAPFGILFGIPGCIGIAFGNLLADLNQGMAPHQMTMGFFVNFLAAFIPYLAVSNAALRTRRSVIEFVIWAVIVPAVIVAGSIWINVALGLTPKFIAASFSPVVFLNNAIAVALLGPPLMKLLYPFVLRAGLYRGREAALDEADKH